MGRPVREAQAVSQLDHPNIRPVHEVEETGTSPCITDVCDDARQMGRGLSRLPSRIRSSSMRAIPLLVLVFACQLLSAQEKLLPVLRFEQITDARGLPSNHIRARVVRDHL